MPPQRDTVRNLAFQLPMLPDSDLLARLDAAIVSSVVHFNSSDEVHVQLRSKYEKIGPEQVKASISPYVLSQYIKRGNRDRAMDDQVKVKLLISKELRQDLLIACKDAFVRMGLIEPDDRIVLSGNGWYRGASYMGWHTNRDRPSKRIYLNKAIQAGQSGLAYYYEGLSTDVRYFVDDVGWTARVFDTGCKHPFWHAVYCYGGSRYSLGFRVLAVDEEDPHQDL